jgi:hypothetical protein
MQDQVFHAKNYKEGFFWKIFNYFLLLMGSSSMADVKRVTLGKSIVIEHFIGNPIQIEYSEVKIKYDNGNPIALIGDTDNMLLNKLTDPVAFAEAVEARIYDNKK